MAENDRKVPEIDLAGGVTLFCIILASLLLRGLRLDELPGGFLVFNEIFYIDAATKQLHTSPLDWFLNPGLYDKPPLYTTVITLLYSLKLPLVASARAVSVFAGTVTVFMTFLLSRHFFDQRTALTAAAALAVMPGVVLVDHNIQVDPLFVALFMSATLLYLTSDRTGNLRYAWISGCLLGLAILTKQPAVLVIPAVAMWETWRFKSLMGLKTKRFSVFTATSLMVGSSWYAIQLILSPARLIAGIQETGNRSAMSERGMGFWIGLPTELTWMVFPLAAAVIVAGIYLQIRDRTDGDKLTFTFLGVFLIYYFQYHFHSYYLLPLSPFLAIAFARACTGSFTILRPSHLTRSVLTALVIASMVFGSVMMLAGHKWGRWSPLTVGDQPGVTLGKTQLFVDPPVIDFIGPFTGLLNPALKPVALDMSLFMQMNSSDDKYSVILTSGPDKNYPIKIPALHVCEDRRYRPVLFGYAIGQWHEIPQRTYIFQNADWQAEKVGPFWQFGKFTDIVPNRWTLFDRTTLRKAFQLP